MTKREVAKLVKKLKGLQRDLGGLLDQLRGEDLPKDEELPDAEEMVQFVDGLNEILQSEALEDLSADVAALGELVDAAEKGIDEADTALTELIEELEGDGEEEEGEEPESD